MQGTHGHAIPVAPWVPTQWGVHRTDGVGVDRYDPVIGEFRFPRALGTISRYSDKSPALITIWWNNRLKKKNGRGKPLFWEGGVSAAGASPSPSSFNTCPFNRSLGPNVPWGQTHKNPWKFSPASDSLICVKGGEKRFNFEKKSHHFLTNGGVDDDFEDFYAGVGLGIQKKNAALDRRKPRDSTMGCFRHS